MLLTLCCGRCWPCPHTQSCRPVPMLARCPVTAEGPPLPANSPINILEPSGYPVRNDNGSSPAYLGAGNTLPEIYTAYHPDALGSSVPIQPGESAILTTCRRACIASCAGCPPTAASWACSATSPRRPQPPS
jgi:hypothetical protein